MYPTRRSFSTNTNCLTRPERGVGNESWVVHDCTQGRSVGPTRRTDNSDPAVGLDRGGETRLCVRGSGTMLILDVETVLTII